MVRPKIDSRLQNIEKGIDDIKEKLCEMHPCSQKEDDEAEKGEE